MAVLKGKGIILLLAIIKESTLNETFCLKIRVGFCIYHQALYIPSLQNMLKLSEAISHTYFFNSISCSLKKEINSICGLKGW